VRLVTLALSGFAALLLGGCVAAAGANVNMTRSDIGYVFDPTSTFVNVGQEVTWTNGSDAPHNVTSDSGTELASPDFNAGVSFRHTFSSSGTFWYHCTIHTHMKGSVVVLAAGETPPAS
jgi:plastocyanin